ncbi:bifunctional folylpolyglutamate synthase/dihydrofolate synthase [Jatrophihabitans telluris]|uniref:tetrahydrofolate synthase n=1 Tax=Jatrophihabitans telluris TaxID=2038343 RepID=A0ABY4R2M5_9ACTN|nr:folylpolyglutamate synthase/dihydrofolate synthase family protein [Jatrophihabitans telluris]UQX89668.1 bifunctional folylpolyglutamate synthase/dihydrofolate synthase [Jatrophihabitans telluris]
MESTPASRAATDRARRQAAEQLLLSRWGEAKISPSRVRIEALMEVLGEPQRAYRSIHITGTNGKTSTARMIEELLRGFGLRTGRYTSPHLMDMTERIVLDGQSIDDGAFADAVTEISPYLEMVDRKSDIPMTFFEAMTGLAFAVFADAPVDVAVVEVGMGGAWDATNVLQSPVVVITPIGLDHTEYLGDTLAEIATEKAGIIHAGSSAILAAQPTEAAAQLLKRAAEVDAAVAREGLEFGVIDRQLAVGGQVLTIQGLGGVYDEIFLPLHGGFQGENAALALAAVEAFFGAGAASGPIELDIVRAAFAAVTSPGRLEPVRSAPTVLVDASHNVAGMRATAEALNEGFDFRQLVGVVAMLADKDARGMLDVLEPVLDTVVVSQNNSPRALDVDELAALAVDVFGSDRVVVEPRLDNAIEAAVALAEENSNGVLAGAGVIVTGSVVTAGEARTLLGGRRS